MKNLDFVALGDIVIDSFIRLKEGHINDKHELCMPYGTKIPFEFAISSTSSLINEETQSENFYKLYSDSDHNNAVAFEFLDVFLGDRLMPHGLIHGRGNINRAGCGQIQRR